MDKLAEMSRYIAPAHCSGDEAKEYIRRKYRDKYINVRTGTELRISTGSEILVRDFHESAI